VRLDIPFSSLIQKSRNRQAVENNMRLTLTNTPPIIPRLAA